MWVGQCATHPGPVHHLWVPVHQGQLINTAEVTSAAALGPPFRGPARTQLLDVHWVRHSRAAVGGARKLHWVLSPRRVPPLGNPLVEGGVHLGPVETALRVMMKRPAHWQGEEGMAVRARAYTCRATRFKPKL